MDITIQPLGERLVSVKLAGRLDTSGVGSVETQFVSSLVPKGNNAIVDLSDVDFVASMGIRLFVSTARSLNARQAKLALFGARGGVLQVFEMVALGQIIPVCATQADALAAVSATP